MKPLEVEILVAEVGLTAAEDQMFHIQYDGTVSDHRDYTELGGDSEAILGRLAETYTADLDVGAAVRTGVAALAGPDRTLPPDDLEVAVLARGNGRRCFRRLGDDEVAGLLSASD
jgi:proteasome alpha subunit